jgi:hypothetical protein
MNAQMDIIPAVQMNSVLMLKTASVVNVKQVLPVTAGQSVDIIIYCYYCFIRQNMTLTSQQNINTEKINSYSCEEILAITSSIRLVDYFMHKS